MLKNLTGAEESISAQVGRTQTKVSDAIEWTGSQITAEVVSSFARIYNWTRITTTGGSHVIS